MKNLYNTRRGETCIVMGNGPSLKTVPLKFLRKHPTFGANKVYLLDGFTPNYYVCVNPLVLEQNRAEIEALPCPKFIRGGLNFSGYQLHSVGFPMFSYVPWKWIYEGYTVTFVSLQLAFFMGFETILLVGVDHRFTFSGNPNEQSHMAGDDPNHFSPDYFKGQDWHNPDLERSEHAYRLALKAFTDDKRKIINLTKGTALNVFQKGELSRW